MAMATHRFLLSLSILLGVLAIVGTARPCKTVLFISSSSSYYRVDPQNHDLSLTLRRPRSLTFFLTEVREINPKYTFFYGSIPSIDAEGKQSQTLVAPFQTGSSATAAAASSIRDRTMDIMSVVGALLFGVGCGVLTASTMYLVWSLFSPARFDFGDSDREESDGDVTPKKMGYVSIPSADEKATVKADVKLTPAKEVV